MKISSNSKQGPVVLIGTYTEPPESDSEGVYVYRMDVSSGQLSYETVIQGMPNVSFMEVHPRTGLIYAVNETESFDGHHGGGVSVLSIDLPLGNVYVHHRQSAGGVDPCYISIEQTGRFVLIANYTSGNIAMLPVQADGRLGPASDVIQHSGSSVHPERQTGPHPHCIIPDPTNRFVISTDLGLDKLLIYHMDLESGKLHKHSEVQVERGAGPRHLIFNSSGQYAYLVNELNSTINVYRYNADMGSFAKIQTVSTLPQDFSGENFCADIHLLPDENHLYVSNRGHDSLVCFRVDTDSGELTYQSHTSSHGHYPRNFAIDPSGHFMVVAHQRSNNVVVLRIDPETGDLFHTGYEVKLSVPVHVKFAYR